MPESRKRLKNDRHRGQLDIALTEQIWKYLSIKINNDSTGL